MTGKLSLFIFELGSLKWIIKIQHLKVSVKTFNNKNWKQSSDYVWFKGTTSTKDPSRYFRVYWRIIYTFSNRVSLPMGNRQHLYNQLLPSLWRVSNSLINSYCLSYNDVLHRGRHEVGPLLVRNHPSTCSFNRRSNSLCLYNLSVILHVKLLALHYLLWHPFWIFLWSQLYGSNIRMQQIFSWKKNVCERPYPDRDRCWTSGLRVVFL